MTVTRILCWTRNFAILILFSMSTSLRADWAFEDEVAGKVVETYVSDKNLEKTLWKEEDEHPPLPPRRAVALAKVEVKRFSPQLDLRKSELVFERVCLEPLGPTEESWVWVVEFGRIQATHNYEEKLRVVVLMTGEVIKPSKIRDNEAQESKR